MQTLDGLAIRRRSELLRRTGFRQTQVIDPSTSRQAWMWSKVWLCVRDAVIATADGALGYRVWEYDFDPDKPFTVEDDITLWKQIGEFLPVSDALLALSPPPNHPFLPSA